MTSQRCMGVHCKIINRGHNQCRTILHLLRNMVGERRIGNMGSDNQAFFIGSLKIKRGD